MRRQWNDEADETWHSGRWSLRLRGDELADIAHRDRVVLRSVRAVVSDRDGGSAPLVVDRVAASDLAVTLHVHSSGAGSDLRGVVRAEVRGPGRLRVFTDLESSTRLWESFPDAMREAVERHDAILSGAVTEAGGHVVKVLGDGLMAVFPSAPDGLRACLEAQRLLRDEAWGETGPLRVRMGLHAGEAQPRGGDWVFAVRRRAFASAMASSRLPTRMTWRRGPKISTSRRSTVLTSIRPGETKPSPVGSCRISTSGFAPREISWRWASSTRLAFCGEMSGP